jgi:hypothetical protein
MSRHQPLEGTGPPIRCHLVDDERSMQQRGVIRTLVFATSFHRHAKEKRQGGPLYTQALPADFDTSWTRHRTVGYGPSIRSPVDC